MVQGIGDTEPWAAGDRTTKALQAIGSTGVATPTMRQLAGISDSDCWARVSGGPYEVVTIEITTKKLLVAEIEHAIGRDPT